MGGGGGVFRGGGFRGGEVGEVYAAARAVFVFVRGRVLRVDGGVGEARGEYRVRGGRGDGGVGAGGGGGGDSDIQNGAHADRGFEVGVRERAWGEQDRDRDDGDKDAIGVGGEAGP